ncbi:hypothetical protein NMG60_11006903 [Bertholletia excelsa]
MGKNEAYGMVAGGGGAAIGATATSTCTKADKLRKSRGVDGTVRGELAGDLVAAMTQSQGGGVQRKKRMARVRRFSVNVLPFPPFPSYVPPPLTPRAIDRARLRFLFEKQLQMSDVGSLRRIILPKKAAEDYLPTLREKEGFLISMDDMDGLHLWSFKFRYWPNNSSRMYVLENTGEFVNTHGLKRGDYMMLYQDYQNQNYVIGARKVSGQVLYTESAAKDNFCDDFEMNASGTGPEYLPIMDDSVMPFVSNNAETSYVYETTSSKDSLFDFWSGPMTYNNSRVGPIGSFESFENSSLEELILRF